MIDGLFPSGGCLQLEQTHLALTRYAAILTRVSFCPRLHHGIKSFCYSSAKWYGEKYDEMFRVTQLWYDTKYGSKKEVLALNAKIQSTLARTLDWSYEPAQFLEEFQKLKSLPARSNLLEALSNSVNNFTINEWPKFLKTCIATQNVYESIAALYYECTLVNRQLGGFDVFTNLKLAFEIKNPFIRKIAIRITFIYKENSEHSFSESQFQLEKLNAYVLADGKEPITLIEQLIEEKNELILREILKELEIPYVDGLIHHCLNRKQARNVEFLMRFPHELKDEKLRALVHQFPSPPRKNTTVNTADPTEWVFIERKVP